LEKVSWLKGNDIDSSALKMLNETLGADKPIVRGGRLCTEMLNDLKEKMDSLKLSETLLSSDVALTASSDLGCCYTVINREAALCSGDQGCACDCGVKLRYSRISTYWKDNFSLRECRARPQLRAR